MTRQALASDPEYLKAAFGDLGLSEIPGPRHNARVLELFQLSGHPEIKNDETAWCAAAVGGWLAEAGYPNSGSLMARSYSRYGVACDLKKKIPRGAIIVWPRGAPPSGHVNICLEDDGTYLTCIGGNQGNGNGGGVTISRERKYKAIAARLPVGVTPATIKRVSLVGDIEEEEPETGGFLKLIKSKIVWASSALGGISLASIAEFVSDWRVLATIGVLILVAYIIYERSKKP